eukprot:2272236-Pyramimonas_sp.AAC.1
MSNRLHISLRSGPTNSTKLSRPDSVLHQVFTSRCPSVSQTRSDQSQLSSVTTHFVTERATAASTAQPA